LTLVAIFLRLSIFLRWNNPFFQVFLLFSTPGRFSPLLLTFSANLSVLFFFQHSPSDVAPAVARASSQIRSQTHFFSNLREIRCLCLALPGRRFFLSAPSMRFSLFFRRSGLYFFFFSSLRHKPTSRVILAEVFFFKSRPPPQIKGPV